MSRYIAGDDRTQSVLFPERLDDWVEEDNAVRVVDVFVDALDLGQLGFERAQPAETGRPAYHPATLLKIYVYGYLNRIQSSRRLEREAQRNVELIWLTGRLMPDFKTIADFRRDDGAAIVRVCREFVLLCRRMQLFGDATVAIDGSKFKAVNNRDKNFTDRKLAARMQQVEESIAHYLDELDRADQQSSEVAAVRVPHLQDKLATVRAQAQKLAEMGRQLEATPDRQVSLTDPDARSMATSGRGTGIVGYSVQTAVDTKHHLIVEHEVTNLGHDRTQLSSQLGLGLLAQRRLTNRFKLELLRQFPARLVVHRTPPQVSTALIEVSIKRGYLQRGQERTFAPGEDFASKRPGAVLREAVWIFEASARLAGRQPRCRRAPKCCAKRACGRSTICVSAPFAA